MTTGIWNCQFMVIRTVTLILALYILRKAFVGVLGDQLRFAVVMLVWAKEELRKKEKEMLKPGWLAGQQAGLPNDYKEKTYLATNVSKHSQSTTSSVLAGDRSCEFKSKLLDQAALDLPLHDWCTLHAAFMILKLTDWGWTAGARGACNRTLIYRLRQQREADTIRFANV
jgi:hypothetical protein